MILDTTFDNGYPTYIVLHYEDISRIWKINLLFSRKHGNAVIISEGQLDWVLGYNNGD